ncbi:hypothetical protein AVEN_20098-2-1, partial [Araneus ventricosus]
RRKILQNVCQEKSHTGDSLLKISHAVPRKQLMSSRLFRITYPFI